MSHKWNFPPFLVQVCQVVPMPANHLPVGSTMSTVHLSSDGTYFYWIWSPASLNEKTPKGHSVFMDTFELVVSFTFSSCVIAETFLLAFFLCWFTRDLRNLEYLCSIFTLASKLVFLLDVFWRFLYLELYDTSKARLFEA